MPSAARPIALFLARVAVALTAAATAILVLAYAAGPERHWLFAKLQYGPYLAYLVPALVALACSMALGLAWRAAAAGSLLALLLAVMGLQVGAGEAGEGRVRLMTYNIKGYLAAGRPGGALAIAAEIAQHDPDVVVLQDASDLGGLDAAATRLFFGDRQLYASGQFVIASRFPLRDCGAGSVSFRGIPHSFANCSLLAQGRELEVLTAHLITPRHGLNAVRHAPLWGIGEWTQNVSDRLAQADALARRVSQRRAPLVLAGDLNAPQWSMVLRRLRAAGLRDAFAVAGTGYGYTYGHSLWPGLSFLRLDHILVSPEIAVRDCFTGGAGASPHRPVVADLYVSRL